jgi:hypothetical protein
MKSALMSYLDEAITPIRMVLAQRGFRARKRTFNRRLENGIIQVVQVTMGRSDPPGTVEVPGLRRNWHGTFGMELGVYIPEVAKHLLYWQKPKLFPGAIDCSVRLDLAQLSANRRPVAWNIEGPAPLYEEIADHLERDAMPFFSRHADRHSIVAELTDDPEQDQVRGHAGHSEYLRELAVRLQLEW